MRVSSPCVQVCVIDPVTRFCMGCGRTGEEIASWPFKTEDERLTLMAQLPERMKAFEGREAPAPRVRIRRQGSREI